MYNSVLHWAKILLKISSVKDAKELPAIAECKIYFSTEHKVSPQGRITELSSSSESSKSETEQTISQLRGVVNKLEAERDAQAKDKSKVNVMELLWHRESHAPTFLQTEQEVASLQQKLAASQTETKSAAASAKELTAKLQKQISDLQSHQSTSQETQKSWVKIQSCWQY